jgi:putative ABC transport system substrate-binding protein
MASLVLRRAAQLALLLVALGVWATDALAQRHARIGVVYPESHATVPPAVSVFWRRLQELGWAEGRNLTVESRYADGRTERLPSLIQNLVRRKVDLLVTWTTSAAIAAKEITEKTGTPVVVPVMGDPIATGIVTDLARPGGTLTGLALGHDQAFVGKWIQFLQETVPGLTSVTVILNPENAVARKQREALKLVAQGVGVQLRFIEVRDAPQLEAAFRTARGQSQAFVLLADPLTMSYREQIVSIANNQRMVGIYVLREFVDAGGLMSYGADNNALFYRAAEYADRVLRGEKPGDLPIEVSAKYELVVNLRTAKRLGVSMPQSVLLRADEVIQ